jgi:hypothetical protein
MELYEVALSGPVEEYGVSFHHVCARQSVLGQTKPDGNVRTVWMQIATHARQAHPTEHEQPVGGSIDPYPLAQPWLRKL